MIEVRSILIKHFLFMKDGTAMTDAPYIVPFVCLQILHFEFPLCEQFTPLA